MFLHPFVRSVADFAQAEAMIHEHARVLVALSGGPDSCALLLALLEAFDHGLLPCPTLVAHFHHQLRGTDADADAAFAGALCARHALPCVIELGVVRKQRTATTHRASPQAAARTARYAFLEQVAGETGCDTIATAHTADDQAETVLLRVLRGTGLDGLAGIPAVRPVRAGLRVVRPLLTQTRADVEAYCRDKGVAPRRDPSNENPSYARARLRALLPDLERFNPQLRPALQRLAQAARQDRGLLNQLTDALWTRVAVCAPRRVRLLRLLENEHPALRRRVLMRALEHAAGTAAAANAVTAANVCAVEVLFASGRGVLDLPGGVRAQGEAGHVTLESTLAWRPLDSYDLILPLPGRVWVRPAGLFLRAEKGAKPVSFARHGRVVDIACGTMGSGRTSAEHFVVRSPHPGDRIRPWGMRTGSRLVRDLMREAGWPNALRASAPLVVRPDSGEVLWIVGLVQAELMRTGAQEVVRLTAQLDC